MAVACAYCRSPNHVWWDCPKKPAGWKPSKPPPINIQADVERVSDMTQAEVAVAHKANKAKVRAAKKNTTPRSSKGRTPGLEQAASRLPSDAGDAGSNPAMGAILKRGPGRPRIHPDRKAYKAMKERERRARLKPAKP
jgi:hypothetical protein